MERPEEYEGNSLYYREIGKDNWMMPLTELTGIPKTKAAKVELKARVYYRGAVPSKPNQQPISKQIIAEEEARGFKTQGLF